MTSLFLYMFYVGFGLTVVSVILGVVDLGGGHGAGGDLSAGHAGGDFGADAGSVDLGHVDFGHVDTGHGAHVGHADHGSAQIGAISPVNFQTIVAAIMGFGGLGYLTTTYGVAGLLLPLLLASAGGLSTAWLIYRFQSFLKRGERALGPTSYIGLVGKLTVPIREEGTGEVVYTQQESRMVSSARSFDGKPIAKGEEVVILRYEKGIAYVQLWREFMDQKSE